MKRFALAPCIGLLILASASLQAQEVQRYTFDVGAGFTNGLGTTGNNLDTGWNVGGGAGVNINNYLGVKLNLGYNSFGLSNSAITNLGVPGGAVKIFSARIDPVVHLNPKGHTDVYVTGGGGMYYQYQSFTQPTTTVAAVYNPFFGFFPAAGATSQSFNTYSVTKPGIDAGVGVAFGSKWHGKFFAEARYNRIFFSNSHTDFLPVTFGFRW